MDWCVLYERVEFPVYSMNWIPCGLVLIMFCSFSGFEIEPIDEFVFKNSPETQKILILKLKGGSWLLESSKSLKKTMAIFSCCHV